ncbi:MAG: VWA domain-containing protein [Alphaproteobacteria bacterium]|nr:VWA domain-containing protein [Alphaproteobacteria bacterium]
MQGNIAADDAADVSGVMLENSSTAFGSGADEDIAARIEGAKGEKSAKTGDSFIPMPIDAGSSNEIGAVQAPKQVAEDPLAAWRQSANQRAQMEMANAPQKVPRNEIEAGRVPSPQRVESDKKDAGAAAGAVMSAEPSISNMAMPAPMAKEEAKKRRADTNMSVERVMPVAPTSPGVSSKAVPAPAEMLIAPPQPPVDMDIVQHQYQDVGRDQFRAFEENSIKNVAAEPVSTFSIDVDTSSYSFVRRALNNGYLPQKNAIRIEEMINYFDYDYAVPEQGGHPFQPTVAVYDSPWRSGNKLVHIGVKGYQVQEKPKSNLVFLIDTSGSMHSSDKLPLLVNSFKMLLDTLSPDDTIGIVTYAGSSGVALQPTKVADKYKIMAALDSLQSGGSTAGAEGIRQAYQLAEQNFAKDGNNRIILATDGDFNVGITNQDELKGFVERKRKAGVFLSVLGFGQGNYNDSLMQTLAQNGNGNAAYIDSLNEARKVLVDEGSSMLFTIAKDVKLQVEFNPQTVQEYRLVGYETRALNREDFNNDKVDAGDIGAGHTVTAIYEITPVGATPVVDDLRYQKPAPKVIEDKAPEAAASEKAASDEYAFLKIRYKKPDSDTSTLMTRAITKADEKPFAALSDDIRFANAVASFAQILKGSKFVDADYDTVIEVANQARGKDEFGYRTEFVNLVRLAKNAAGLPQQR